jgi:hypothetical protein
MGVGGAVVIPARDCLSMPLNMQLSFAHSNVAAVEGAWPVVGFTSHQQMHGEPSLQVVLLGAPASLASIMVIGPHHAAVTQPRRR